MTLPVHDQLRRLIAGQSLDAAAVRTTIGAMMDHEISDAQTAAWLTAMSAKGETADEIVGAASAMRERSLRVEHDCPVVLDVCGTGGDGFSTINISTAVSFVVSALGIPVAKHGNRSSTSACGSIDVLETLGVEIDRSPLEARLALEHGDVAFLFAQRYHPAMRALASLRRDLGIRTIFNVLGPLTNPARATCQLIGVSQARAVTIIGEAAQKLGIISGAVVHAENGLDEVSGDGVTTILRFTRNDTSLIRLQPAAYDIQASIADLKGGDAHVNARALVAILEGEQSPRADVVALNAAVAVWVADLAPTIETALVLARRALSDGSARAALTRLQIHEAKIL